MISRRTVGLAVGFTAALAMVMFVVRSCQMRSEQERRNAPLLTAIDREDVPMMFRAVDAGADRRLLGYALFRAACGGESNLAMTLLARGAPVTYRDMKERTALSEALRHGDVELVEALLDHGAGDTGWGHQLPLSIAVIHGDGEMARMLLRRGEDVNGHGPDGVTPLMRAVGQGSTGLVRLLLAHGADPNVRDEKHRSALDRLRAHPQSPIVRLLRQAGARE